MRKFRFETDNEIELANTIEADMVKHNGYSVPHGERWLDGFNWMIITVAHKAKANGRAVTPRVAYGDHEYSYVVTYKDGFYGVRLHNAVLVKKVTLGGLTAGQGKRLEAFERTWLNG